MPPTAAIPADKLFDARALPCEGKHALIFQRWAAVPVGDYLVLLNDHRPEPLHAQFEQQFPGCFRWSEIATTPGAVAVKIERLREDPAGIAPAAAGSAPANDDLVARLELDTRTQPADEAAARVLRFARNLRSWTELVATSAAPIDQVRALAADGFRVQTEALPDGAHRYRIRRAD